MSAEGEEASPESFPRAPAPAGNRSSRRRRGRRREAFAGEEIPAEILRLEALAPKRAIQRHVLRRNRLQWRRSAALRAVGVDALLSMSGAAVENMESNPTSAYVLNFE